MTKQHADGSGNAHQRASEDRRLSEMNSGFLSLAPIDDCVLAV